jgi:hypothetical protein
MDQFLTETELVHLEKKIASAESERLFQKSFVDKLEEEKKGSAVSSETESLEGISIKIHETWVECDNCKKVCTESGVLRFPSFPRDHIDPSFPFQLFCASFSFSGES